MGDGQLSLASLAAAHASGADNEAGIIPLITTENTTTTASNLGVSIHEASQIIITSKLKGD